MQHLPTEQYEAITAGCKHHPACHCDESSGEKVARIVLESAYAFIQFLQAYPVK